MPSAPPPSKMLVAVTGASGHVGRRLVAYLRKKKVPVLALVRSTRSAASLPKGTPYKIVDLESGIGLSQALSRVTHIINLTGKVDTTLSDHELALANVLPTQHLLTAAPPTLKRFVHVSSIAVYGKKAVNPVNEHAPRRPDGAYARTKYQGERLAQSAASRFPVTIIQPAIIYGPGYEAGFHPMMRQLQSGQARLIGDGNNRLPFVHVDDVVTGLYAALFANVPSGSVFLLSSPDSPTQKQALNAAAKELGVPAPTEHVSPALAYLLASVLTFVRRLQNKRASITPEMVEQLSSDRVYDISAARQGLHWHPAISFKTGVRQVVNEYKRSKTLA